MAIEIGIKDSDRKAVAEGLSRLLADSYTLSLKTHNSHWNVTGPQFNTVHGMFELQYTELAAAIEESAERIRALGDFAPGSYAVFGKLTTIDEATDVSPAEVMTEQLVRGHEAVVRTARHVFPLAEKAGDAPTCDLLTQRMPVHEKAAWMLRGMLA